MNILSYIELLIEKKSTENSMKKLFIVLTFSLLILSCGKSEKNTTSEKEKTTAQDNKQETGSSTQKNNETGSTGKTEITKPGKPELKWEFKRVGTGEYDTPINDINIIVNGKNHFIAKEYYSFSEMPASDYKSYEIPAEAIIAARGWWAGAGIDYWAIQKDNEIIVMKREIGETTDESGEAGDFMGKPEKVISIKIN